MPLCQIVKQEAEILDWTDEDRAFEDLILPLDTGKKQWVFRHIVGKVQFSKQEVRNLGRNWHTHPDFANTNFIKGIQRIQKETDAFLESLGYRHDLENNCYYAERENNDRIALFAHEDFHKPLPLSYYTDNQP